MAEPTVRMVNADGVTYDIPHDVMAKAFADGLRPAGDASISNAVSDSPLGGAYRWATQTQSGLGALLKQQGQEVLIGDNGATYVVPAAEAMQAVTKGHLRRPDLADDRDRKLVAEAEASVDPSNFGTRGAVKAFTTNAASSAAKAASFGVINPDEDAPLQDKATMQELDRQHGTASGLGSAAGFIGGAVADPFGIAGGAVKAGAAAERAVVGEATTTAGRLAAGLVRGGTEGAVMSVPAATRALIAEDPDKAGEVLLAGIGIGAFFGGGGAPAGAAKKAVAEKAASALTSASENAEEIGQKLVDKVSKKATAATGAALGGLPGYVAGEAAGGVVAGAAEKLGVQKVVSKAIKLGADGLLKLGPTLDEMAEKAAPAAKVTSIDATANLLGRKAEGKDKQEQFELVRDRLTELHADTDKRTDAVASMVGAAGPEHQVQVAAKATTALDYLYSQLPKQPQQNTLFQKQQPWSPSGNQLASFERKVQVVADPWSVVTEMRKGTLTRDHVDALRAVYPAIAFQLRDDVLRKAADPKAPVLNKAQRQQLQLLLGQPLDDSSSPAATALYQSFYKEQPPPVDAPRPLKLGNAPSSSSMTDVQRVSNGLKAA